MTRREFAKLAAVYGAAALLGAVGGLTDGRKPRHREHEGKEPP